MRAHAPLMLMSAVLLLILGAGAALIVAGNEDAARAARVSEFQSLVGGLGFGPALDLGSCAFAFDPRVSADFPLVEGALPGFPSFRGQAACSIFSYPPLGRTDAPQAEAVPDVVHR